MATAKGEPAGGAPARGAGHGEVDDAPATGSVHPALATVGAEIDAAGIRWALLRGAPDGSEADVDLLAEPGAAALLSSTLAGAGFLPLPAIGHGGHRFFRRYDEPTGQWLTLDVVTELAFGPAGWLPLRGVVNPVLDRRSSDPLPRLAPDDAFWALLLHDLLDRSAIPAGHAVQLVDLAPLARADGTIGRGLDELGGPGTAAGLLEDVRRGDTPATLAAGRLLGRRWLRRDAIEAIRRRAANAVLRRLRKPFTAVRRRGIGVAVLGPDGAGKSSVAAWLGTSFPVPARTVYLGLYAAGLEGPHRFAFVRRLARLWRGWLAGWWHRTRGRLVIYDRHAIDALLPRSSLRRKARLRRWILGHAIPMPDLVLILDAPAEVLFARKGEHTVALLDEQRRGYLELAAQIRDAEVVDASRDTRAVQRDVTARTWRRLAVGRRG